MEHLGISSWEMVWLNTQLLYLNTRGDGKYQLVLLPWVPSLLVCPVMLSRLIFLDSILSPSLLWHLPWSLTRVTDPSFPCAATVQDGVILSHTYASICYWSGSHTDCGVLEGRSYVVLTLSPWHPGQGLPSLGCLRLIMMNAQKDRWVKREVGLFSQSWDFIHTPSHYWHIGLSLLDHKSPWIWFINLFSAQFGDWHILERKKFSSVLLCFSGWSKH